MRRGAWVVLTYVTSLFFAGVIVQFFLAALVLLAWPKRRLLLSWIALAVLAFVQGLLAGFGFNHWVIGMFHPVNALVLLGLSGYLARHAWTARRDTEEVPTATVVAG